ncbi:hypothetical protein RchiOBHm_Chr4g0397581 [Rosa chinensis]|uniref:Uncharacterized protein n=1 Tax=Rosa chinensis TaxID=74649 RepID=A0A2P6QS25_ROSCH|nr:hypothetical protein RchiOBHm_Chr4g0397581 [Rosa chinensis]
MSMILHFFSFSCSIESIEMVRSSECACTAYVTSKDPYSHETACLLSASLSSTLCPLLTNVNVTGEAKVILSLL